MDAKKTSLKTLIGLPVILIVAGGVAFGAARLSDALSAQSAKTLTAEESESTTNDLLNINDNLNVNSAVPSAVYSQAVDTLAATMRPRYALRALLPGETAVSDTDLQAMAQATLETICWMWGEDQRASKLPSGVIRDDFAALIATYHDEHDATPACNYTTEEGQLHARLSYNLEDDGDGLTYPVEIWYGTNPLKADTDNDGFSDREEITNGYSPLKSE